MLFIQSALALLAVGSAAAAPLEARQNVPMAPTRITKCTVPGTIALTFDDGPLMYTEEAVKQLDAAGMKGTFFVNGQNWGSVIANYGPLLKKMQKDRHQIASHTFNHADLVYNTDGSIRTRNQVKKEMIDLEVEMRRLIGYWSNWMRAPYTSYTPRVTDVMKELGYYIVDYSIDTKDYEESTNPNANYDKSYQNFLAGLNAGGNIVLSHDVHAGTVRKLLPRMIAEIKRRGLKAVTVGECLGTPYSTWYKVTPRA